MRTVKLDLEELVGRWEDKRDIKNLLGRFAHAILFKDEETIYDEYWSKSEDVCYGTNHGWYAGAEAVKGYFNSLADFNKRADDIIKARFPEETAQLKDTDKGLGTTDVKAFSAEVIELAGDGKTAKGILWNAGQDAGPTEIAPLHFYTFGVYAVDFLKENDEWKIWHMDYQEDINSPMGEKWWDERKEWKPFLEFASLAGVKNEPNVPVKRREYYSLDRDFQRFQPMPEPYGTFADTFSYGM